MTDLAAPPTAPSTPTPTVGEDATHDLQLVTRVADSLADLMRSFVRTRAAIMQAAEHDVDWSAQVLLRCLRTHGPMRAGAVAEEMQADPSTVSRQVTSLVKEGLIRRQADPADGRASLLALTEQADGVLQAYDQLRAQYFADMLGDWSQHEVSQFAVLLERFTTSYKALSDDLVVTKVRRIADASRAHRAAAGTSATDTSSTVPMTTNHSEQHDAGSTN